MKNVCFLIIGNELCSMYAQSVAVRRHEHIDYGHAIFRFHRIIYKRTRGNFETLPLLERITEENIVVNTAYCSLCKFLFKKINALFS